jgi:multiple sugar transport system substrate-binding protein
MKFKHAMAATAGLALTVSLSACSSHSKSDNASMTTIHYALWDSNQQPAYQKCAIAFQNENPHITIKIDQTGWDDYWTKLTTGFQSGTAPDVFTDHVTHYPEFVQNHVLLPLDDVLGKSFNPNQYLPGLANLWVAQDGKRYGLPKDWDTVALFYNKKMVKDAGLTDDDMKKLTWNPTDGGSFQQAIAKLTVDKNGVRGDQKGFDKNHVKTYGYAYSGAGGDNGGQTESSWYTTTTGWTETDKNPWGTHYNFDDPRFQQSIAWWKGLIDKGYAPPLKVVTSSNMQDDFGAGKAAINPNGDWTLGQYHDYKKIDLGVAPTPVGPDGKRASMFNGLADSIFAGTKHKDAAVKWVEFLGSAKCQDIVGQSGVVFPAIQSGVDAATKAFQAKGFDITPFTTQVADKTTFLAPITDHAADVGAIMEPAMENVLAGKKRVDSLTAANAKVNALFK